MSKIYQLLDYQNPASADFNIQVQMYEGSEVSIRIFDTAGRIVYQEEVYQDKNFVRNVELKGLSNGVYHIVVKVGHQVMNKRLIKD